MPACRTPVFAHIVGNPLSLPRLEVVVPMIARLFVALCVLGLSLVLPSQATASDWWLQYSDRGTGLCLDIAGGSSADGAILQEAGCKSPIASGAGNQRFQTRATAGGYLFVAMHSGKCMQIQGGSLVDGAIAQQLTCTGAANQVWQLPQVSENPNGSFNVQIRNVNSGKCLRGQPTGTALTQVTCASSDIRQVWRQHLRSVDR